jgi:hypothetical protein
MSTHTTIVILTRDEERCVGRCLDSVTGRDLGDILVIDTGSVDKTLSIVEGYRDRGVRLIQTQWANSFAAARNAAIAAVRTGWLVFLDADEWFTEQAVTQLGPTLAGLESRDLSRTVFAPSIVHVDRAEASNDVPRILKADSGIRFVGAVHEYPVAGGESVEVVGLDLPWHHDGYERSVTVEKNKRKRNLRLLETARINDPDNPRWLYYTIRDGLPVLEHERILELCAALKNVASDPPETGDRRSAGEYYQIALGAASQRLVTLGDWRTVHQYCDDLPTVDAHYFRTMFELLSGSLTSRDLMRTIALRGDEQLMLASAIDLTGRHVDALIVALLERFRDKAEAEQYLDLCHPWSDVFFDRSRLRF